MLFCTKSMFFPQCIDARAGDQYGLNHNNLWKGKSPSIHPNILYEINLIQYFIVVFSEQSEPRCIYFTTDNIYFMYVII